MNWQDGLFGLCACWFIAVLIRNTFDGHKPARWFSANTAVALAIIATTHSTLDNWLSYTLNAACSIGWLVLYLQRKDKP